MKYLTSRVGLVGMFFAATALLLFYLLSIRVHNYLPVTLFWVAIALMLGTITYQVLKIELSPFYTKVVLLEIAITCLVFHLIYQIPYYGLRGADAYGDMASAKGIISSGFVRGDPQYITKLSYFPLIHIFGAIMSLITNMDLLSVAKWFPSLIDVALILLLYLLVRSIFKEEKIALLSTLLFACLQHHILFSSLFIRETIALTLAVFCVYLYFSAKYSLHPARNYTLSILCLIGTVIAHHLTSFMLSIFLLTHFLVTKASTIPFLRKAYFGNNLKGEKIPVVFVLLAFTSLLAYWTYVSTYPLYSIITLVKDVFSPNEAVTFADMSGISTSPILSIRGNILYYGFFFFHLIFGLILLYKLLPRTKFHRVEAITFTLLLFLCGIVGLLSLFAITPQVSPNRFLMYGWLFGFSPIVLAILKIKFKWLRRAGVLLLIAFMLFNIYMIKPAIYDPRAEEVPAVTSEVDYALANTFNFSRGKIFGHQNPIMAIYDVHNNFGKKITLSEINLTNFEIIVIQQKILDLEISSYPEPRTKTLAALEHLANQGSTDFQKIYDSNNILVFIQR